MSNRINIAATLPEIYKSMFAFSASVTKAGLPPIQKELIKVRASQINQCAYCLDMHTKEALKAGETQQRIFLLNAWKETDLFTEEEKAVLALTEEVTLISQHGVSDATYAAAAKFFSAEAIAQIIMSVILINAWNRIAISTQLQVARD